MKVSETITFPDLIELNHYRGNYDQYENALLDVYEADLWKGGLTFNGIKVVPRVHKRFELNGKMLDWTFAHFTSKGPIDEDRELDLRRCERIGWVKPIIENAHQDFVKIWEDDRADNNGKLVRSVVLWCEKANAKVVLTLKHGEKSDYYVVTTFYLINNTDKINKHNQLHADYVKNNGEYKIVAPKKQ